MRRPLYLDAGASAVALDGPALRVSVEGRADGRFPLRLLDRVVARSGVEWSSAALDGCLGAGVPVTLLRADGQPLGFCLPARPNRDNLDSLLAQLAHDARGPADFAIWAQAEERRAILTRVGRPWPYTAPDLRPGPVRRYMIGAADADPTRAASMLTALEGLLSAHLVSLLHAAGLGSRHACPSAGGPVDLHEACRAAARWELLPALDLACAHRREHPSLWAVPHERRRRMAVRYEAAAPRIAAVTRRRLRRLEGWLRERRQS